MADVALTRETRDLPVGVRLIGQTAQVGRSSIWRRAQRLDWWIDPSDVVRYRQRKDRGTRVPLNHPDIGQYGRLARAPSRRSAR